MSSTTKIINVLKDDSFAEILNLFKSTPSGEVIFVLPKRSKAFQKEEHFAVLKEAADEVEKTVSFLSSNPEANEFAEQHGFEVLLARAPSKTSSAKVKAKDAARAPINVVNQIESFYKQPPSQEEIVPDSDEEIAEVVPVVARRMTEVVHSPRNEQRSVKVSAAKEKSYPIEVHSEVEPEDDQSDDVIEQVWASATPQMQEAQPVVQRRQFKMKLPKKRRMMYTFGSAGFVVAAALIYWNTGSAQVTINPAVTSLTFQLSAAASESVASVDTTNLKIPGQTFTIQKSVSQTFNATGSKDVAQKARGSLVVSNKTSSAQQLIATTRFESSDGHVYRSLTSVVVPAAKNDSTPGTAEVQVIADKIGSDYNVPAGDFIIVAFKEKGDTSKLQNITGKSSAAMHGGTSGKATVVTQDDFNKAKDLLTVQLKQVVSDETKAQTAGLKVINDADVVIAAPESTASVDDAADTFTMTLNGTLKTAGFKEEDLQKLISAYTDTKYKLDVVAEKLTVKYSNVVFDTNSNVLRMTVSVAGPGYAKVDQAKILADLLGKKQAQIESYLKALPGISSANVLLSPVWVRSVPKNSEKVHINVTR